MKIIPNFSIKNAPQNYQVNNNRQTNPLNYDYTSKDSFKPSFGQAIIQDNLYEEMPKVMYRGNKVGEEKAIRVYNIIEKMLPQIDKISECKERMPRDSVDLMMRVASAFNIEKNVTYEVEYETINRPQKLCRIFGKVVGFNHIPVLSVTAQPVIDGERKWAPGRLNLRSLFAEGIDDKEIANRLRLLTYLAIVQSARNYERTYKSTSFEEAHKTFYPPVDWDDTNDDSWARILKWDKDYKRHSRYFPFQE